MFLYSSNGRMVIPQRNRPFPFRNSCKILENRNAKNMVYNVGSYVCLCKNDAPNEVILSLVERFVNRTYRDSVEELKESNLIDEETEEKPKNNQILKKWQMKFVKKEKSANGYQI